MRQTSGNHSPITFGNQTFSLRWHLLLLVVGALLPIVLFAIAVVHKLSAQEQAASERRALLAARNLAGTIEREVASTVRTLEALAASEQLDRGNLEAFYNEASRAAKTQSTWLTLLLLSPDGRQLVNTRQPFGAPLPSVNELESLQRVVVTGKPTVGDLALGHSRINLAFPVRVPVIRDRQLQYVLTAVITPDTLAKVVEEITPIDGEWTRTIVDGRGFVVARTRNPERFVGKRGTPSFLKRTSETPEDVYRDTTLEGEKVYVAFRRTLDSRWTAAVTVPVRVVQGPTQRAIWVTMGSGFALLVVSSTGALLLSRQISRSITLAAAAAEALAKGDRPQVKPSSIKEVALLGESIKLSANLLWQREQERAENLARAEAAREEAIAANRIKDEFLAVLSHELRSPLNPILGWSRLLRSGKLDAAKTEQALEIIERNAKLQTQLIEDLLDVSRILQGKLNLTMTPVNLALIVEAALETVRLAAEAKSIQIHTEFNAMTGQVLGDAARLQQIIWNLLSNAVKFTSPEGQVTIRLEQVGAQAQIQISDTGHGISPEFLPYVFDYFRQADSSTTRKFGGLGLGLAIVRHLVELHGGTIQAHSPGEGKGATFSLQLPLLKPKPEETQAQTSAIPDSALLMHSLQGLQILLVDDEKDARDVISFILSQAGAVVTTTESAIAALKIFPQIKPHLIVSDIGMPEMDGYRLIERIRKLPPEQGGTVPAIALTAYASEIDRQQALSVGFYRHLAKPVEPDELVKTIVLLLKDAERAKS